MMKSVFGRIRYYAPQLRSNKVVPRLRLINLLFFQGGPCLDQTVEALMANPIVASKQTMQWNPMGCNGHQWITIAKPTSTIKYTQIISNHINSDQIFYLHHPTSTSLIPVEHSRQFALHVSSCHMNQTESRSVQNSNFVPPRAHSLLPRQMNHAGHGG